jgi:signal transduction histidine kinase
MSLRTKMLLSLLAFLALVFGLVTLNLWLDAAQRARTEARRNADLVGRVIGDLARAWTARFPAGSGEAWAELSRRLGASELVSAWLVAEHRDGTFHPVASSDPLAPGLPRGEEDEFRKALEGVGVGPGGAVVWVPVLLPDGRRAVARLEVRGAALPSVEISGALRGIVTVMALGTALLVLNIVVLLHRMVLRPLDRLVEASTRVAAGDFSQKVSAGSPYDEMGRLAAAFNLMMDRISGEQRRLQDDVKTARHVLDETERQLFAAQRLSTTGTLAAGIAHEINNPLGGMINAARALGEGRLDPAKQGEYLGLIADGLERVRAIVQKILLFRPRPFEPRPVRLRDAVGQAVAFVAHRAEGKGVKVENAVPDGLPEVEADPVELAQAVLNLLMNAVDACVVGEGRIRVDARREGDRIVAVVEDNGCGMTEDELARCLDPFFTTKDPGEGTGLGLSVAHNIVLNHGGRLEVRSRRGEGTVVTLDLPLQQRARKGAVDGGIRGHV